MGFRLQHSLQQGKFSRKNSRANQEFQKIFAETPDFKDVRTRLARMSIR